MTTDNVPSSAIAYVARTNTVIIGAGGRKDVTFVPWRNGVRFFVSIAAIRRRSPPP